MSDWSARLPAITDVRGMIAEREARAEAARIAASEPRSLAAAARMYQEADELELTAALLRFYVSQTTAAVGGPRPDYRDITFKDAFAQIQPPPALPSGGQNR